MSIEEKRKQIEEGNRLILEKQRQIKDLNKGIVLSLLDLTCLLYGTIYFAYRIFIETDIGLVWTLILYVAWFYYGLRKHYPQDIYRWIRRRLRR